MPTVAEEFWAASRRKRERQEEIEAMPHSYERLEAHLADAWSSPILNKELYGESIFARAQRNQGNRLDEWLADDGLWGMSPVTDLFA